MRTCRISPRSLGTKILFLAALAIWTIIGALLDVVERDSVNYVDDPWYDWMDKKRYRPLPGRNVTYAKIQVSKIPNQDSISSSRYIIFLFLVVICNCGFVYMLYIFF